MGVNKTVVLARISEENLVYLDARVSERQTNRSLELNACVNACRVLTAARMLETSVHVAQGLLCNHFRIATPAEIGIPQRTKHVTKKERSA